jgi:uncharacterized YccA/Bax inhibitor family protein
MNHAAQQQVDRPVLFVRLIGWFLGGLVASAVLVVVIPPLDLLLLIALIVTTIVIRVRDRRFSIPFTGMLLGVLAFSIYALVWALILGSSGTSASTGSGFGLILFLPVS